jgi:hypothetical protein
MRSRGSSLIAVISGKGRDSLWIGAPHEIAAYRRWVY